jgi:hypothetical protein
MTNHSKLIEEHSKKNTGVSYEIAKTINENFAQLKKDNEARRKQLISTLVKIVEQSA